MSRLAPILALLIALGLGDRAYGRGDPRLEVELALGISGSTELKSVVMTSPLFTLSAPISDDAGFIARWGFTLATGEPTDPAFLATWFAAGNPLLGWSLVFGEGLVFSPSLTLPIAHRPERGSARPIADFAARGGLGLFGAVDPWLWRMDQFALVLPVAFVRWLDPVLFEAHAAVGMLVPTTAADADDDFVLQLEARLAAHLSGGLWLATGVSAVYIPTDTGDNFQSALAPELRYVVDEGSHLELSVLMNLDPPLGPSTTPGRFWAVHIGGSARL